LPSSTPVPTSTPLPRATATPVLPPPPTATCYPGGPGCPPAPSNTPGQPPAPSNTSVPRGSPTPTPPADCDCESIDISGTITKGQWIYLVTKAIVVNPDVNKAKVLNMVYHVEKNGVEIDKSGEITALGPERTTGQNGKPIDRYYTTWKWKIPDTVSSRADGDEYKIWAKINCIRITGIAAANADLPSISSPKKNDGLLNTVLRFLGNFLGINEAAPVPPPPTPVPTMTVLVPTGSRSLQLGTFIPSTTTFLEKGCHIERYPFVRFRIK